MKKKLSELKTVSLSKIARENLLNCDDATIYHNDKILVFLNYSNSMSLILA